MVADGTDLEAKDSSKDTTTRVAIHQPSCKSSEPLIRLTMSLRKQAENMATRPLVGPHGTVRSQRSVFRCHPVPTSTIVVDFFLLVLNLQSDVEIDYIWSRAGLVRIHKVRGLDF